MNLWRSNWRPACPLNCHYTWQFHHACSGNDLRMYVPRRRWRKRESVQVHYHVQIESKMSWTIAWHLTLLNAFQLCCNFGTCQRLSLGTSLSSGVEFAIPVLIVFILRKLWFWNAFTWPTTSIQIKWWNFITNWHIGHGYVVYFTPWFFLPSFWVHPSRYEHPSSTAVRHILYGWTVRLDGEYLKIDAGNSVRHVSEIVEMFIPNFVSDRCQKNAWRFIEFSSLIGFFHWMLGFLDGWYARAEGHR